MMRMAASVWSMLVNLATSSASSGPKNASRSRAESQPGWCAVAGPCLNGSASAVSGPAANLGLSSGLCLSSFRVISWGALRQILSVTPIRSA